MDLTQTQMHIILADDDEDDRIFFEDAINELKMNSRLTTFADGKELMNYLADTHIPIPHILFLDLNMPCKTGAECLHEIRSNPRLKNMTIAIYSTSSSEKDIEETFIGGANIYIQKPTDFKKLKQVINDVVNMNWQYHTSGLNKETFFLSI